MTQVLTISMGVVWTLTLGPEGLNRSGLDSCAPVGVWMDGREQGVSCFSPESLVSGPSARCTRGRPHCELGRVGGEGQGPHRLAGLW